MKNNLLLIFLFSVVSVNAQLSLKTSYYSNKQKEYEGKVDEKGQKQGEWKLWLSNGKLYRVENFKIGLVDGESITYLNDSTYSKYWNRENKCDSSYCFVNEKIQTRSYYDVDNNFDSTLRYDENGKLMFIRTNRGSGEGLNSWTIACGYNNKLELENCDTVWLDSGIGNKSNTYIPLDIYKIYFRKNFYKNGNTRSEGWTDSGGRKQGSWEYFTSDGIHARTENYSDGKLNGDLIHYQKDTVAFKLSYTEGNYDTAFNKETGKWIFPEFYTEYIDFDSMAVYDKNKNLLYAKTDKIVKGRFFSCVYELQNKTTCDSVYVKYSMPIFMINEDDIGQVDTPAEFPGGYRAMNEYIKNNTSLPAPARAQKIYGKVSVSFIVETDGTITNIEIVKSLGYGCDEELMYCIKKMPLWKPAMSDGKPVRTRWVIPVVFGDRPTNKKIKYESPGNR